MDQKVEEKVKIVELTRNDALPKLKYRYMTSSYYDLSICREANSRKIMLALKPFEKLLEKKDESKFFSEYIEEPRVFAAELGGEQVGWIELGYHKWNSRMRVWQFLVKEEFRRRGIGTLLMKYAVKISKERGARMLVLETQTCNVPAVNFYLKKGFELIGFDTTHYSNEDIEKKEVRLELGLTL
jgi:ribosomal protein S18 acetylase RimI-like enzyme